MSSHMLIGRSFRFRPAVEQPILGWIYRRDIGAWVDEKAQDQLMVAVMTQPTPPQPEPRPRPEPPMSKKADLETGEDMKGA